ncbi:hypothetical protein [Diplocloster modestus]|uniref:Zinc ribbon domain-containing protein n=1 Tax=Diplocloster modestus TaxID=2850322 RepID=A0ABS6K6N4_9FIRM|nr:hypothetical protein [Diplocloster modestus]MBU9726167.1 hypothetical protein [Diplocloster modestus]
MVKCVNCEKDVEEGLMICPYCGKKVNSAQYTNVEGRQLGNGKQMDVRPAAIPGQQPEIQPVQRPLKSKQKRKRYIVWTTVAAGILVILLAVFMIMGRSNKNSIMDEKGYVYIDTDGNAYCHNGKGKWIKVEGDWRSGFITWDGRYIVLNNGNNLYLLDGKGKNPVKIANAPVILLTTRNNGLLYMERSGEIGSEPVYRYLFDTKETTKIGQGQVYPANDSLAALVFKDQGIYILPESADEPVKVASCEEGSEVELVGISNNGKMAVWTEKKGQTTTIYTAENMEKEKLGSLELKDSSQAYTYAFFFNESTEAIVGNGNSDRLFRKKLGEECIVAKTEGGVNQLNIYTIQGRLSGSHRNKIKGIYVVIDGEEKYLKDLYYIDENGNSSRVIWNILRVVDIQNGKIVMLDKDFTLYETELQLNLPEEFQKISTDVEKAQVSKNGNYIYYGKDMEDETFTLYEYKNGINPTRIKIADDVFKMKISADGNQVIYLKNPVKLQNADMILGDLYVKDVGKEPVKASSDIISIFDKTDYITNDDWYCFQYDDIKDKKITGAILHYDGRGLDVKAENIIYDNIIIE